MSDLSSRAERIDEGSAVNREGHDFSRARELARHRKPERMSRREEYAR
jgi:hypothetical protein